MQSHSPIPDTLQRVREALLREDPSAEVRAGSDPLSIKVASNLPHTRISTILHDVLGQNVHASCDEEDAGANGSDGCCGCCGH